jgi:multiple sugar transport system substrate-binding protein
VSCKQGTPSGTGISPLPARLGALFGAALSVGLACGLTPALGAEITVWTGYPEMVPFYEHVAEGMKAAHPDLTVSVEAVPLREHEKRVALGLTSGAAADVIELGNSTAARYLENGLFQESPQKVSDFVSDSANFDKFFLDSASYDGKVYGVPLFRWQSALYYNLDMFKAAGLTKPPATMEEFSSYAEKLTQRDAGGKPTVSGWSMRLSGGGQGIAEKFWINLFQYGGRVLEKTADGKWRANFANEAGHKTLAQYLDNLYKAKTVTIEMPADAEAFEREQTAMFIRESWVIGDIAQKAPNLHYATANLPHGAIGIPDNLYASPSADPAAWDYILATNEPDNLVWLLKNVGWLPNRHNVDYSPVIKATPQLSGFLEYPADYGFFDLPAIGPIDEILTRLAERLTAAYGNPALAGDDAAIDKVLTEAQDDVNGILEREGLLGAS